MAQSPKKPASASDSPAPARLAGRDTPMLRQFLEMKEQVPDCVLFFHMGDFYEMFFEDAELAVKVLGIQLTSRDRDHPNPIPMCGVPCRAVDTYLAKMVEAGHKVAVCDQVEDPRLAKGLVRREITRVVSPGMFTLAEHLPAGDHRYLAALYLGRDLAGLAHLDLASGEFRATAVEPGPPLADELARLEPAELVLAESQAGHRLLGELKPGLERTVLTLRPGRPPTPAQAEDLLGERLPPAGEVLDPAALVAAALAWDTVQTAQRRVPDHVEAVSPYQVAGHLLLDATARRNLEIYRSLAGGGKRGSLLAAVDRTVTPMGARLLAEWLGFPLLDLARIAARHQAVEELGQEALAAQALTEELARLPDVPRLVGRASLGQAGGRDLAALRDALALLPAIAAALAPLAAPLLAQEAAQLAGLEELARDLGRSLSENPPLSLAEGGVIAPGVDPRLDELRELAGQGKGWIAALESQLRAETGIPSLKVGFNRVFGYYIEVTRAHQDKVPPHFVRKQTLATAERYFTPELKDKEAQVLGAQDQALELEKRLFEELRARVAAQSRPLMAAARSLAALDVLAGLAALARSAGYTRPRMEPQGPLVIKAGRHPVVEQMLPPGEFVPNDLTLDDQAQQVLIITGPNMAGKSTILRQAALIVILAQAGSFVPAEAATLPLVDRVFTRVGAMDDLARGRSTFMVEMSETSQILAHATPRSLVILDEVGRGTSTFDGLSLAWAVAEYLHSLAGVGVKTLFATHYHELTELAEQLPRVKNYNVAVKEFQGRVVFLRRLQPGGVSRSYGLQVARLAGLPEEVLARARQVLDRLENGGHTAPAPPPAAPSPGQLSLFGGERHPVLERLKEIDVHRLTPLEALNTLDELKRGLS
ncbi:MAG: DNA mismatch repair protein MutS [Deltaproteobacteria bacterium]|nr:DNA mismatch repair protein MutS [Deltaproteobacteria bacterium]